jgi:hypothetical protein
VEHRFFGEIGKSFKTDHLSPSPIRATTNSPPLSTPARASGSTPKSRWCFFCMSCNHLCLRALARCKLRTLVRSRRVFCKSALPCVWQECIAMRVARVRGGPRFLWALFLFASVHPVAPPANKLAKQRASYRVFQPLILPTILDYPTNKQQHTNETTTCAGSCPMQRTGWKSHARSAWKSHARSAWKSHARSPRACARVDAVVAPRLRRPSHCRYMHVVNHHCANAFYLNRNIPSYMITVALTWAAHV